ncbi:hypothetical protein GmHk_04G009951 [Glycine max]|nr:hypothetical protein GmHk_04G009951 [Glycine max]
MNKNQWIYGSIMSEEININADNGEKSNVFVTREDVLQWTRTFAYDICFVVVIMRSTMSTTKQVYNVRYAYRSSIKGSYSEMQQLMKLLEHDQYIH